ncbi:hypothetical protein CFIO01_05711 [Colletotrichum fioriniae PJ7]|uniref:AAA+ ATPase domain-containing protein n=1 Tax=Colletotrichum fioriniae PJ7 TaxID=1445577 RepID=A0A010QAL7_9PEZI|nr:hypothetical protein CFIO01_05711 [Colletotrichum fioriniae PJ7]
MSERRNVLSDTDSEKSSEYYSSESTPNRHGPIPPRHPKSNYGRSSHNGSMLRGRPQSPRNVNEFGIDVGHLTVHSYRNHKGAIQTFKQVGMPLDRKKRTNEDLVPRVSFIHEVDDTNDFEETAIEIEWSELDNFMERLERFPYPKDLSNPGATSFPKPFIPLFLRLGALEREASKASATTPTDSHGTASAHSIGIARAILLFLDENAPEIRSRFKALESASPSTLVQYDDVWMLYKPGQVIFERTARADAVCYMVDYPAAMMAHPKDDAFKKRRVKLPIPYFGGKLEVSKLYFVPERFMENLDIVKGHILSRGRNFWDMNTTSRYRQFAALPKQGQGWLSGIRVIVDAKAEYAMKQNSSLPPGFPVHGKGSPGIIDLNRPNGSWPSAPSPMPKPGLPADVIVPAIEFEKPGVWFRDYDSIPASSSERKNGQDLYNVAELKPVQFAADSWKRLVLKTEYKEVIWAMVKSYLNHNTGFHDLVEGKGEGLVVLLHGPPGVGKTLTAECVAESFKKPLYMVTAGDLGTNPDTLEAKLSTIFDHAVAWDAILLLDEADIFLQDRDYDNLHRNALVSKYFNGIMFLTSNRVGAFDQAFQSRIHITIGMPEFDETLRKGVWKIFIQDLGRERRDGSPPLLSRDECKALGTEVTKSWASQPLNGRQIRNCVRSALALAENEGVSPNASHFNKVINLGNAFTKYMTQLQKAEAEEIAQIKGDRLAAMKDIMARDSDL